MTNPGCTVAFNPHQIRCLTVWQPWASLLMDGLKPIENRDWRPSKTGWTDASRNSKNQLSADVRRWRSDATFAWFMNNPIKFERPIKLRGLMGQFKPSGEVVAAVDQLHRKGLLSSL